MFCFMLSTLFAIPVALLTYRDGEHEINESYHVQLFQSSFLPESIRSYFKIKNCKKFDESFKKLDESLLNDKLSTNTANLNI